jgi:hypothetical protein
MDILGLGTPFGLAFASGLNAYLPLLAFAVSARWLDLYKVNSTFSFTTRTWFIVVLAILTILDFVAEKIPLIDHAWNAVHTFVRPLAGALVAAAAVSHYISGIHAFSAGISSAALVAGIAANIIPVTGIVLLIIAIIGAGLALLSHTSKSIMHVASTITTAGLFTAALSFLEDILALVAILLSLFAPAIMLLMLVLFLLIVGPRLIHAWNR